MTAWPAGMPLLNLLLLRQPGAALVDGLLAPAAAAPEQPCPIRAD